jgi:hypothetical protein
MAMAPDQQTLRIVRAFTNARGRPCRVVEQSVLIGGQRTRATGTVCQQSDGQWVLAGARDGRADAPQAGPRPHAHHGKPSARQSAPTDDPGAANP